MLVSLLLAFLLHFLLITCGRLSWLSVSFLLGVKYTVSHRIVSRWMGGWMDGVYLRFFNINFIIY